MQVVPGGLLEGGAAVRDLDKSCRVFQSPLSSMRQQKAPAMHLTQGRLLLVFLSLVPCVLCIALAFPTSPVVPRETSTNSCEYTLSLWNST